MRSDAKLTIGRVLLPGDVERFAKEVESLAEQAEPPAPPAEELRLLRELREAAASFVRSGGMGFGKMDAHRRLGLAMDALDALEDENG